MPKARLPSLAAVCTAHATLPAIPTKHQCQTKTHTHTFNGPLSGTTQVGRYQKGKTNLDFTEARNSEVGGVAQW